MMKKHKIIIVFLLLPFCLAAQQKDAFAMIQDSLNAGKYLSAKTLSQNAVKIFETTDLQLFAKANQLKGLAETELGEYKNAFVSLYTAQNLDERNPSIPTDLGILFNRKGEAQKAITAFSKAENLLGTDTLKEPLLYGKILNGFGIAYFQAADLKIAVNYHRKAKFIRLKYLGEKHQDYAWSLNNLGATLVELNQLAEAELLYKECATLRAKYLGENHIDYAYSLLNLGGLYDRQGKYVEAEPLYIQARTQFAKHLGKQHIDYCKATYNLGNCYTAMFQHEKAMTLFQEILNLKITIHPFQERALAGIALVYYHQSKYVESETYYQSALKAVDAYSILEYNRIAQGLGALYMSLNRYREAELCFLNVKKSYATILGENSPEVAEINSNLAALYFIVEKFEHCEEYLIKSLSTITKNTTNYANILINYSVLKEQKGQRNTAINQLEEAKEILQTVLGTQHPNYARCLYFLGALQLKNKDMLNAEKNLLAAKAIQENKLLSFHPDFLNTLQSLIDLYEIKHDVNQTTTLLAQCIEGEKELMNKTASQLSDIDLQRYIYRNNQSKEKLYRFLAKNASQAQLSSLAYDNELFYKGYVLLASSQLNQGLANNKDTAIQATYWQWKHILQELNYLYTQNEVNKKRIKQAEIEAANLEVLLLKKTQKSEVKIPNYKDIQSKLTTEDASIEFITYKVAAHKDSIKYAALLLKANSSSPQFIFLCSQNELDKLLNEKGNRKADYVEHLYAQSSRGMKPLQNKEKTLKELLLEPLLPHLRGITSIYYTPSGLLHRINFDAIEITPNQTLADVYNLFRLNSTREIKKANANRKLNTVLIYSNINFEEQKNEDNNALIASSNDYGARNYDNESNIPKWESLSWTLDEGVNISNLFDKKHYHLESKTDSEANESHFKNIFPIPNIIHLATHGFFFSDTDIPKNGFNYEPIFKTTHHPMLRSGLILAGANIAWTKPNKISKSEDGILTAYEIAQQNLQETELVTLSACETGLGDISNDEGVLGLQRAFKIAGVKNIIMSLWQVPDFQTQDFMVTFYTEYIQNKQNIHDSFYKSQKQMRKKYKNPYFWAGFVLLE